MKRAWLLCLVVLAGCPDDPKYSLERLEDPDTCMDCHAKHYEQWSGSMHAYASDDPVFLAMNARGQRETNGMLGDFCLKCHAPMAVKLAADSGQTLDAATFDPKTLPKAQRGITCFFCHNVASIAEDHNNGLVLAMDQTMRGGAKKPADSPAHKSKFDTAMASATNNSTMCGSCHDVVTPGLEVHLERTFAEWKTTIFALNDPAALLPATCSRCHMTPSKDVIASGPGLHVTSRDDGFHDHTMAAIDKALTPFPHMDVQEAEVAKILKPAIAIVSAPPQGSIERYGGICVDPLNGGQISVRIDAPGPGHSFPSGAAQDRRVWLEVTAYDASNNVLLHKGQVPDGTDPEENTGDTSMTCPNGAVLVAGTTQCATFFDKTFQADGSPAHFFWDVSRYESALIRPAITRDTFSPQFDHSTTVLYPVPGLLNQIDRVEAKIWVRPLAFGMIDELIASGDLDPAIRTALAQPTATMLAATSTWLKSTAGDGLAMNTNCNPQ